MQAFYRHPSFNKSAGIIDFRGLGKQRVGPYQILNML